MVAGGVEGLEDAAEAETDLFGVFTFVLSWSLGLGGSIWLKFKRSSVTHSSNRLLYSIKCT